MTSSILEVSGAGISSVKGLVFNMAGSNGYNVWIKIQDIKGKVYLHGIPSLAKIVKHCSPPNCELNLIIRKQILVMEQHHAALKIRGNLTIPGSNLSAFT